DAVHHERVVLGGGTAAAGRAGRRPAQRVDLVEERDVLVGERRVPRPRPGERLDVGGAEVPPGGAAQPGRVAERAEHVERAAQRPPGDEEVGERALLADPRDEPVALGVAAPPPVAPPGPAAAARGRGGLRVELGEPVGGQDRVPHALLGALRLRGRLRASDVGEAVPVGVQDRLGAPGRSAARIACRRPASALSASAAASGPPAAVRRSQRASRSASAAGPRAALTLPRLRRWTPLLIRSRASRSSVTTTPLYTTRG